MTRGFSVLEVLIALAILTTTLIAVALLTLGLPGVIASTRTHADGTRAARQAFLRELARGAGGFGSIQSHETPGTPYSAALVAVLLGDGSAKRIESTSSWRSLWGETRSVTLSAFATDYMNAADYACSPFRIGDGEPPELEGGADIILPSSAVSALGASRTYVVAAASSTRLNSDPSLFLFRNGAGPLQNLDAFDSASSTKVGYVSVAVSPTHAYALSAHTCPVGQYCASLDIFALAGGKLVRVSGLPLPPARSIAYRDTRLYVGLRSHPSEAELVLFDIADPEHPVRVGSGEVGATVNDIRADDSIAYIATSDNSISGNRALMAYGIASPGENMPVLSRSRQAGAGISQHLALSGTTLYLGRSSPLNSKELYLFDRNDIVHERAARDTDSSVAGILIRGAHALVLTRTRLERWDIGNPNDPEPSAEPLPLPRGMSGSALACSGRSIYIAANDQDGGHLLTLDGL